MGEDRPRGATGEPDPGNSKPSASFPPGPSLPPAPPPPGQMGETENDGSALGPSHADCRLHESKDRGYFVFSFFFFPTDIIQ